MIIAIDAMGGDHAPGAVLEAVGNLKGRLSKDTVLALYGTEEARDLAEAKGILGKKVTFTVCSEVIGCDEAPAASIRKKKDSSLVRALTDIAAGKGDAIVSAGNTGALLTGATLIIRRLPGIKRPALATALPTVNDGHVLLLDSGANTDCRPEYLEQFALMGSVYAKRVLGIDKPRVGLLNNGAEEEKGCELTKAAYQLLKDAPVNFMGNCEARDVLSGDFDVVTADGFDGNILLKSIEGTASAMFGMLKKALYSSTLTKLGALLAKPAFKTLKKKLDYSEVGGAPLLGVKAGVIKAHGSSDAKAFSAAVLQAERFVSGDVLPVIADALAAEAAESAAPAED